MTLHPVQLEIYVQHHRRELLREAESARIADLLPRLKRDEKPETPRTTPNRLELALAR